MNVETFLANFGHLAEAPNGIPKLRELILQLAVRGKLVSQDPNDEPAAKSSSHLRVEDSEIPQGWIMSRLDQVGAWAIGTGFPKREQGLHSGKVLFCKVSDMNLPGNETYVRDTVNTIDEGTVARIRAKTHPAGTVVFPKIGGAIATNKRRILERPTAIDNNCLGIIPGKRCTTLWLLTLLRALDLAEYQTGTSVPALSQGVIGAILVGLPPLAEQKQIVAKVDELITLCDSLEAKQQAKRKKQIALNRASLHALTHLNGTSLATAWHRVRDHFNDLYTVPETVAELRQTILQLAVMGRLIPQDPNDEPASELLKKIQAERQRLIAEGKIRKPKLLPPIEPDEVPYELPRSWVWVRFGEVVDHRLGKMLDKQKNKGTLRPYLRNANVRWFGFDLSNLLTMRVEDDEFKNVSVLAGDLVICEGGEPGRTAIWDKDEPIAIQKAIHRVRPLPGVFNRFVAYVMRSDTDRGRIEARFTGATIKHLTGRSLNVHVVPLPPLAEQKRIVAKVDALMGLCDDLEAKLQQAQTGADSLIAAIVHELVENSNRRYG